MGFRVITRVEDGLGTVAKAIEADTADDWKQIQIVFHRACNLWPDAPPSIKALADRIIEGKVLQDYEAQDTSPGSNDRRRVKLAEYLAQQQQRENDGR
jgi:hypothetical protein